MKYILPIFLCLTFSCSTKEEIIVIKEYFPTGELKYEFDATKDSVKHGNWKWYFKNGELRAERTYELGFINGELITYQKNGKIFWYDQMTNDTINGYSRQYDYEGELVKESFLVMGEAISDSTKIFKNWKPDGSTSAHYSEDSLGNVDSAAVFIWKNGEMIFNRPFNETELARYKLESEKFRKQLENEK